MLTEDNVIDAVRDHLTEDGWQIVERATVTQRGHDLVAERGGRRIIIETKGAGSSKPGTARFGQEFDRGQVFDHVGKAVLKALRVVSAGEAQGAIALPGNDDHRSEVRRVADALAQLGVVVFWVTEDGAVAVDGALG